MDIGTGIAIAGVWLFVALSWYKENAPSLAMWVAWLTGFLVTGYLKGDVLWSYVQQ
jgi:hypothetical protein